jgi:hypothetical protein
MTAKLFVRKSVEARKEVGAGLVGEGIDEAQLACYKGNMGIFSQTIG